MIAIRYTDLPLEIVPKICASCAEQEAVPVLISRKSNHPDDTHLFLVLAEQRRSSSEISYIVWTYNKYTDSLNSGAYGLAFPAALKNMSERLWNILVH